MVKLTFYHEVFKVPSLINPFPNLIKNSCSFAVSVSVFLLGNIFGILREQVYFHSSVKE